MEVKGLFNTGAIQSLLKDEPLFPMVKVSQQLSSVNMTPQELPRHLEQALAAVLATIHPGMRVGITAGSRGIDQIVPILAGVAALVRQRGGKPFIVPCMGSHGLDAAGQEKILAGLGITEGTVGAPVASHPEVITLPAPGGKPPAYIDRFLYQCDGIIVVNRVKAHTAFRGPVESGLQKMIAIGMGKQKGAASCHQNGFEDMAQRVIDAANLVLATGKILFGLAILEDARGKLYALEGVAAADIPRREPELLLKAKRLMPSLPFDELDILIVDEMGKDISGSGMDTNIIGRYPTPGMTGSLQVGQLVALSLTPASEGSGHGMGFADFVSLRLFQRLDFERTYPNGLTNRTCGPAKLPPVMPNDKTAIQAAVRCCALQNVEDIRAARIKNTHHLSEFYISPALLNQSVRPLEQKGAIQHLCFDDAGNILDDWQ